MITGMIALETAGARGGMSPSVTGGCNYCDEQQGWSCSQGTLAPPELWSWFGTSVPHLFDDQ